MTAATDTPDAPTAGTPTAGAPDLPQELSDKIRDFARALPDMDYYEVLGVGRDADAAAIRDAFFERSKLYHPDRYFNKELGVYRELLHEVYKRVVVAHDVLRDAKLKTTYDKALGPVETPREAPGQDAGPPSAPEREPEPPTSATSATSATSPSTGPRTPTTERRGAGRSLRDRPAALRDRRNPLAGLRKRVESGQKKAERLFEEAKEQKAKGDFQRAADRARLAAAYDPRCKRYVDLLAEILPKANAARVTEVRRKGRQLLERGQLDEAVEALAEAAQLAPTDAPLAAQIAELFEKSGVVPMAIEYAKRAVDLEEQDVGYRKLLGRLYKTDGQKDAARKQLQRAWEMDPMDEEVKAELAAPGR